MPMNKFQQKVFDKAVARIKEFPKGVQTNIRYLRDLYDNLGDDWTPTTEQNKMLNSFTTELGRLEPQGMQYWQKSGLAGNKDIRKEDKELGEDTIKELDPYSDLGYGRRK